MVKAPKEPVAREDVFNAIVLGAQRFLREISKAHPGETLYGFLFEISCEGFEVHGAAATEERLAEFAEKYLSEGQTLSEAKAEHRWGSPEGAWYQNTDAAFDAVNKLLGSAAMRADTKFNGKAIERLCIEVLKELDNKHAFGRGKVRDKVVLGLCHIGGDNSERDFLKWAKQVNSPVVMKRLRAELKAASQRSDEGMKALRKGILNCDSIRMAYDEDLEEAGKKLVSFGAMAIPALLDTLDDSEVGWFAARCVAMIGIASPEIIDSLRRRASKKDRWCAIALGVLGDIDWLCQQDPEMAVEGINCAYGWMSKQPLNYLPLEAYLAAATITVRQAIEKNWNSNNMTITVNDIDEAIRGLRSEYTIIRQHAVNVLDNRRLGKKAGERILPEVAKRLTDSDAHVIHLAILTIERWGIAGKPYRAAIQKLLSHPEESVRNSASSISGRWSNE